MKMKKALMVIGIILIVIAIVLTILVFNKGEIYKYTYDDNDIPGSEYIVELSSASRKLNITVKNFCSAIDCDTKVTECSITLTKDEYNKVMSIWDDKENVSPILEKICGDDKVFYRSFEYSYMDDINEYRKIDADSDGKVTYREFANKWLDDVIKEK